MADNEDVLAEIIEGTTPQEHPADVLYLCLQVGIIEMRRWLPKEIGLRPDLPTFFAKRLREIGKILCPIFDVGKLDAYQQQMIEVRLEYRGIAENPELQRLYSELVMHLVDNGEFRSLQHAIESRLYERLSLRNGMLT